MIRTGRVFSYILLLLASFGSTHSLRAQIDFTPLEQQEVEGIVSVSSVLSVTSAQPAGTYDAATVVSIKPGWHINSAKPYQDWLIPAGLEFDTVASITPHDIVFPQGFDAILIDENMSVYGGRTIIPFQVTVAKDAIPGQIVVPVRVTYQPCNDKQCLPPRTINADLVVNVGPVGGPANTDVFGNTASSTTTPDIGSPLAATDESDLQRLINEHGLWGYFLALGIAFLTGMLLSFSPCTYPMIPITVSVFAGQTRSVGRGLALSAVYVVSMAVMYGLMGLVVSLVGGVFGAWLASPPVVIAIAIVLVIFSLSMFGLYELQAPLAWRQKLGGKAKRGGVLSTIILGVVAALVISPCVGPFVAGILVYVAASGSPVIGFLVLFVFAIGLGTLYIIIGTFSSAISRLPGSGEWMESVKKFFGFVLLMMALYFLRTILAVPVTAVLAAMLLIAFGVFGGGLDRLTPETPFFPRLKRFLGILALATGLYLLIGTLVTQGLILPPASQWLPAAQTISTSSEISHISWKTDLDSALSLARVEGKPVLIDTWATWCANCRVLDKKTFGHPAVADEVARFIAVRVQLEKADTPATRDFMSRFGLSHYSLPTTLLLDSKGEIQRILKGVVGPDEMIAEMRKVQ